MKENKYDDENFFEAYSQMARSVNGLESAGEWHLLKPMLGTLSGKEVLDLGCGYGWHCRYASEQGALSVVGVDISKRMIEQARQLSKDYNITYIQSSIEGIEFDAESFDTIISSLAIHYVEDFQAVSDKAYSLMRKGGSFIFSVEHPIFTSHGSQDWYYHQEGEILHWPLDHYHDEGLRNTTFLGESVIKYHRTLTTYINALIQSGFTIESIEESHFSEEMLKYTPEFTNENRRPMFLLILASK